MQATLPYTKGNKFMNGCYGLPDGWRRVRLDSIVAQITSGSRGWAEYYADSGSVFVRITNLQRGSIALSTDDLRYVKLPKDNAEGVRTRLVPGDILISITAELGLIGYYSGEFLTDAYVNQHIALVRPDTNLVCPKYVAYTLLSRESQKDIASRNDSGSKSGLNLTAIRALEIPIPPRSQQQRIIAILETADAAVGTTDELIEAKVRYKCALTEQLVTGNRRFAEFKVQKWHKKKMEDCLMESPPSGQLTDPTKRLTVRLHMRGVEARGLRGTEVDGATVFFKRRAGQFIYGKQNLHHGAIGIVPNHLDGFSSSQDIPAFDWKEDVDPQFILRYLSRKEYYEQLERLATGTGSKRIQPEAFLSININLPSLDAQGKIAEVLGLLDEEIVLLRKEVDALKKQKQELMQRLLTGQVRVKEFAE